MAKRTPLILLLMFILLPTFAVAGIDDCSCYAPPDQKRCVYSEYVVMGQTEINGRSLFVSFESNFFDGLERILTAQGFEFRKAGQPVTEYPDTLTVILDPVAPMENLVGQEIDRRPRKVTVKWLDGSHRVIDSKSGELHLSGHSLECCCRPWSPPPPEPVEPWPELKVLRGGSMRFVAEITGIKEPLATDVEVVVTGRYNVTLASVPGRGFYLSSAAASREPASSGSPSH
jgi:hypothetical protein